MFRWIVPVVCVILLITAGLFYLEPILASRIHWDEDAAKCAFCHPEVIQRQQFYEGKTVRVLLNYKPLLQGHSLVIPKRHVVKFEDLSDEEVVEMRSAIAKVQHVFQKLYHTNAYILTLQNGRSAGQTVPHVHFHMIPRSNENIYLTKTKLWLAFITEALLLRKPLGDDEMQRQTNALKEAFSLVTVP